MNQSIELSKKLFSELEKKKKFSDDSIENVIWSLIDQLNTYAKNELLLTNTKGNFYKLLSNKTLKDVFG